MNVCQIACHMIYGTQITNSSILGNRGSCLLYNASYDCSVALLNVSRFLFPFFNLITAQMTQSLSSVMTACKERKMTQCTASQSSTQIRQEKMSVALHPSPTLLNQRDNNLLKKAALRARPSRVSGLIKGCLLLV